MEKDNIDFNLIKTLISFYTGVDENDFFVQSRKQKYVVSRQLYSTYLKDFLNLPIWTVAKYANIDRAMVYYYWYTTNNYYDTDYDPISKTKGFRKIYDFHKLIITNNINKKITMKIIYHKQEILSAQEAIDYHQNEIKKLLN